jgi:glycosyltransferase involved in cell wall biosynthesis
MNAFPHRFAADSLMVIVPDHPSALIAKGEVVARYYNPGELFRNVHIVLTNDDRADAQAMQTMVGAAKLTLHNLPTGPRHFVRSLGWQFPLLEPYLARGVALAREIRPSLVRTHNNFLEGVLASRIKSALGVPYITSLHGVWDVDDRRTVVARLKARFRAKLERRALADADAVIAVYAPIVRYACDHGAKRIELIYNIVAGGDIARKTDYKLARPPKLLTINRQLDDKNPANIIRAVASLDCTYTLVGDGPLHESLKALAAGLGCADRVRFIKSVPNAALCAGLKDYDLIVSHCDYWGMSKTIIEGGLAGLPIITNRHPEIAIAEYDGGWIDQCENTEAGYRAAIIAMLESESRRRDFGDLAHQTARDRFDPSVMEARTVALYRETLRATT